MFLFYKNVLYSIGNKTVDVTVKNKKQTKIKIVTRRPQYDISGAIYR